jgi:hypothetical protein
MALAVPRSGRLLVARSPTGRSLHTRLIGVYETAIKTMRKNKG